jgi:hypothetical protein
MADPGVDLGREALLRALQQADVAFVLIGGAALQSHGQTHRTDDVDVTPKRSQGNLHRLATVLNALRCKLAIDPSDPLQDVPLPDGYFTSAVLARQDIWNLKTTHGKLDITFQPAGFPGGYESLCERADPRQVAETSIEVPVAALEDVEHSKRTADRPKDRTYLTRVGRLPPPQRRGGV